MKRGILALLLLLFSLSGKIGARQASDSILSRLDDHTILLDWTLTPSEVDAIPYAYTTFQEAASHLLDGTEARPMRLLIAPGVYWVDDPDDSSVRVALNSDHGTPYGMTIRCEHLHIEGLTDDPRNVILASNRGQTQGALGNFTMLRITGDDIQARNLTFGNYCNVDLECPLYPAFNRRRRADAIVQAQLVHVDADRVFCDNCRFISRLNLCPMTGARRTLYRNCHFESTDDALQGSAVYLQCHFIFFSSRPWYSSPAWGAVLLDCDIDIHTRGKQYFTKAGGAITVIDTRLHTLYDASSSPLTVDWSPAPNTVCCQHNVTLNGAPLLIGEPSNRIDLEGRALMYAYRIPRADGSVLYNVPNLLAGNDGWDPLCLHDEVLAESRRLGTPLLGLPTWMKIVPTKKTLEAVGDTATATALLRRWGDYDIEPSIAAQTADGGFQWRGAVALGLDKPEGNSIRINTRNTLPDRQTATLEASLVSGLKASTRVTIKPALSEAPDWKLTPTLVEDDNKSSLHLTYQLDSSGEDYSSITWYRYRNPDLSDTIPVREGHASMELKRYRITGADIGWRIAVKVVPRMRDSYPSDSFSVAHTGEMDVRHVNLFQLNDSHMVEDFSTLPLRYQPQLLPGFWTWDAVKPEECAPYDWTPDPRYAWYYGTAPDGARGQGLVEASRGARARYTPLQKTTRGQSVTLRIDPCKTAGQGFGSATGQFLDIYIKMDFTSMTGYALRIARSPRYDRAVVFSFVKYTDGKTTPLTEEVPSSCFRSTCVVSLHYSSGTLSAHAETTGTAVSGAPGISPAVDINVPVEKNKFGGIGFHHTGSLGASSVMIHSIEAKWR